MQLVMPLPRTAQRSAIVLHRSRRLYQLNVVQKHRQWLRPSSGGRHNTTDVASINGQLNEQQQQQQPTCIQVYHSALSTDSTVT